MLDQILTLPKAIQGSAWLLHSRKPLLAFHDISKLAYVTCKRERSDCRLSASVVPCVARDVLQVADLFHEQSTVDRLPPTARAILGDQIAELLADGHTQSEAARWLGIAQSGVAKRVIRCRLAEEKILNEFHSVRV